MAYVIRNAEAGDLEACAGVVNDYVDATDWLPRIKSREEIAALFGPELLTLRWLLVAEEGGRVLGYLSMGGSGHIAAFYLLPFARGRGIGRAMMAEAKAHSPGGLSLTVFEPNLAAQRFYAREGFAEDPAGRDETTDEGVPTLLLLWPGVEA